MKKILLSVTLTAGLAFSQSPNSVELDAAMMPNVHVETAASSTSERLLTATGRIQFNDDRTIHVLSPMPGQLLDLKLRVGDSVQKDDVLFSLKSREVANLATDYLESQRDRDLAEKTFAMTKDLFDHQAASRISLQQAENDLAKTKTHVARAEESLRVLGLDPAQIDKSGSLRALIPVLAPASGLVIERTAATGQYVQGDNTSLLTITDTSTMWAFADVLETDLHLVHPGQSAKITAVAYPNRSFTATVDRIADKVDPETRTIKVRLVVANPNFALKSEMFISVSLGLARTAAITTPASAVFSDLDKNYLFVQTGPRRFERRLVTASADGPGRLTVTSGLAAGDRYVVEGALLLNFHQTNRQAK